MTPAQKIKWAILNQAAIRTKKTAPEVTAENVDELYDALVAAGEHWDTDAGWWAGEGYEGTTPTGGAPLTSAGLGADSKGEW